MFREEKLRDSLFHGIGRPDETRRAVIDFNDPVLLIDHLTSLHIMQIAWIVGVCHKVMFRLACV